MRRSDDRIGGRGAVFTLVLLVVPVLVVGLLGLVDVGTVVLVRTCLQSAADLAALAAVQEVDLESLADGVRWIDERRAVSVATEWAAANLHRLEPVVVRGEPPTVAVMVYNAAPDRPLRHAATGRELEDPTVSIEVSAWIRLPVGIGGRRARVLVRADATVLGPKD